MEIIWFVRTRIKAGEKALKGLNAITRGNALGKRHNIIQPLKGGIVDITQ